MDSFFAIQKMTKKRKIFSEQFKKQIVDLYNARKPVSELSRDYDVPSTREVFKGVRPP